MKKKILKLTAAAMSFIFAFSFTACGGNENNPGEDSSHVHNYSTEWSYDRTDHWHACTGADCDEINDKAAHTWDNGVITTQPTCTTAGEKTYTCTVCKTTKTETIETTAHNFSDEWKSDGTSHWHKCVNCDAISDKSAHIYTEGVCVCGHKIITEGLKYELSLDQTYYSVTGIDNKKEDIIVIPSEYNGLPVKVISDDAFANYTGTETAIVNVIIPSSIMIIGSNAFAGNRNLASIVIPGNVMSIGGGAFHSCEGLNSVTIENGVKSIEDSAFSRCSGITSITIPGSVINIDSYAFSNCSGLTNVTIENGVSIIENSAFYGCNRLTSITIPSSVTTIGDLAFSNCSELTELKVEQGNVNYHSIDNCLIETKTKTLITGCKSSIIPNDGSIVVIGTSAFTGCKGLANIIIPGSVRSVGDSAFSGSGLTNVTIENGVTIIGNSAFSGCKGLASIIIPGSVRSIGDLAFYDSGLSNVTIENGVTTIGNSAFSGCNRLTNITIPSSVTYINVAAFSNCSGLAEIKVEQGNTNYHSIDNCLIETKTKTLITGCKNSVIPDDGSVTTIEYSAFLGCSGLISIIIPGSVKSIDNMAFYGSGLNNVTIENGVTTIGSSAFSGCSGLTKIVIPSSLTSIGANVFADCSAFMEITYYGTTMQWVLIEKSDSWDSGTGDYIIYCTDGDIVK